MTIPADITARRCLTSCGEASCTTGCKDKEILEFRSDGTFLYSDEVSYNYTFHDNGKYAVQNVRTDPNGTCGVILFDSANRADSNALVGSMEFCVSGDTLKDTGSRVQRVYAKIP
jgi:hypothetical protein